MNIALMAHDNKKDLMVQFCTAYAGILSKHTICATNITGKMVAEATGLPIHLFLARVHGGAEQIGARIAYNEIDMVLACATRITSPLPAMWRRRKCSSSASAAATSTGATS